MRKYFLGLWLFLAGAALGVSGVARAAEGQPMSDAASEAIQANVERGGSVLFGPFASTTPRCQKVSDARGWIVEAPRHGQATVSKQRGDIYYREGHHLAYCNDRPISGTMVRYRPAQGFVGDDAFVFVIRFSDGEVRARRVSVHVE